MAFGGMFGRSAPIAELGEWFWPTSTHPLILFLGLPSLFSSLSGDLGDLINTATADGQVSVDWGSNMAIADRVKGLRTEDECVPLCEYGIPGNNRLKRAQSHQTHSFLLRRREVVRLIRKRLKSSVSYLLL